MVDPSHNREQEGISLSTAKFIAPVLKVCASQRAALCFGFVANITFDVEKFIDDLCRPWLVVHSVLFLRFRLFVNGATDFYRYNGTWFSLLVET